MYFYFYNNKNELIYIKEIESNYLKLLVEKSKIGYSNNEKFIDYIGYNYKKQSIYLKTYKNINRKYKKELRNYLKNCCNIYAQLDKELLDYVRKDLLMSDLIIKVKVNLKGI